MTDPNTLNEHNVPLHACNGIRCDEHYWAWVGMRVQRGDFGETLRRIRAERVGA